MLTCVHQHGDNRWKSTFALRFLHVTTEIPAWDQTWCDYTAGQLS